MRSTLLLLFSVVAFATASTVSESGKKAIVDTKDAAKETLCSKLNGTDKSVLVTPIKVLEDLAAAGKNDQEAIAAFGDNDQVKTHLNISVVFWKNKMNEVIMPYVSNPKAYENLVIDFPITPEDPKNTTKAYIDAEHNITQIVKNATEELQKKYNDALKETKAKALREVTCSTYYQFQLSRVYKELNEFVVNNGQWAKVDSDSGEIEVAITTLKTEVESSMKQFEQAVVNICKQFKACTKRDNSQVITK